MEFNLGDKPDIETLKDNIEYAKEELKQGYETMKKPDSYSPHSDQRMMSLASGKGAVSIIISVIFLIWFFGSLILMIVESKKDQNMTLILFGQYFFVFGLVIFIIGIKNISNKKIKISQRLGSIFASLACLLIGGCVGGVGILKKTGQFDSFMEELKNTISGGNPDFNFGKLVAVLFISIFILVGIFVMVKTPLRLRRLRKVATVVVQAKIVDYVRADSSSRRGGYTMSKYPIWGYTYEGVEYRTAAMFPMESFDKSMIGAKEGIVYVDPENPAESLPASEYTGPSANKNEMMVGGIFAGVATFMLICVLSVM